MREIRNLELHVTHACNLHCESCSHYSNQGHTGMLSIDEADRWMRSWNQRLCPRKFSLLGGEPTIHPQLTEFVSLVARRWPDSRLRLVTNGFFLHRHPDLPRALKEHGNAVLQLSIHHDAPSYLEKLEPILELLGRWEREYHIEVKRSQVQEGWTRRYKGFGAEMKPFEDKAPRESWENCSAKFCEQLFEGKIWKCAPLTYLKLQDVKYHLSEEWAPYLGYKPLSPDCSDEELNAFFDREEEVYCNMCPARPERFKMPIPIAAPRTR